MASALRRFFPLSPHASRLTLLILASASLAACAPPPVHKQQAYVFGTLVEITIHGVPAPRARQAAGEVLSAFDALHRRLHAWQPGELEGLNAAFARGPEPVAIAADLAAIIADAAQWSARSDGLFNPAIGNLVRLWGFHADQYQSRLPDPAAIDGLVRAAPAMADIRVEAGRAASRNPAARLDLGGYAKGYALDRAAEILRRAGIRDALVNIGGNVLALGRHGDRPWRVGIQHPRRAGTLATLDLADGEAIGTSGDYQRYFELDGKRYCHLIDPRTGRPAQGVQAVTVIARGAGAGVRSDVASKPLFLAGPAGWRDMARRLAVDEALLVEARGRVALTPAMAGRLRWEDPSPPATVLP
ncbi:MAG: FAD:protein FMN transferase [Thiobacillaceae bacterium]|jgi:thiamine biosynthesis lipoprotein|nr:FAD:protein FMN transferase [Thiobacillaceae bacterium]